VVASRLDRFKDNYGVVTYMSMSKKHSRELVAYWSQHQDEVGLGFDWDDKDYFKICWRCAHNYKKLTPCHIIPKSCGGSDEPSNIVQLCNTCHVEAPDSTDPKFMWIWIRAHAVPFRNSYWSLHAAEEHEKMFGYKFGSKIEALNPPPQIDVTKKLKELPNNVILHFGEQALSSSTLACKLFELEEMIVNESKQDTQTANGTGET
jgi:hypothetical protein